MTELEKEQQRGEAEILRVKARLEHVKSNPAYKAFVEGKRFFDEAAALEKMEAGLKLGQSMRRAKIDDERTAAADPRPIR